MKRYVFLFLAVVILIGVLTACKGKESTPKADTDSVNAPTNTSGDITTENTDEIITTTEPATTTTTQKSSKTTTTTTTKKADKTTTTTAYKPRPKNPSSLSSQKDLEIKNDYLKYIKREKTNDRSFRSAYTSDEVSVENLTVDGIKIIKYYGTYSGAELVKIDAVIYKGFLSMESEEKIAGYTITFADAGIYMLHFGENFMYIEDAYKAGKITKQDVRDMSYYL